MKRRLTKKISAGILIVLMVLSQIAPMSVYADETDANRREVGSLEELKTAIAGINDGSITTTSTDPAIIVVKNDIDIDGVISITSKTAKYVQIQGQSGNETLKLINSGSYIDVGRLTYLTLRNITVDGNGVADCIKLTYAGGNTQLTIEDNTTIKNAYNYAINISGNNSNKVYMKGGTILGTVNPDSMGAVYLNVAGYFYMDGGTIENNASSGICVSGGYAYINSLSQSNLTQIKDNNGAGIQLKGGTAALYSNGIISGNKNAGINCGTGLFYYRGGTISGNTVTDAVDANKTYNYGIYHSAGSTYLYNSNVDIKDDIFITAENAIKVAGQLTCADGSIGIVPAQEIDAVDKSIISALNYLLTDSDAAKFIYKGANDLKLKLNETTISLVESDTPDTPDTPPITEETVTTAGELSAAVNNLSKDSAAPSILTVKGKIELTETLAIPSGKFVKFVGEKDAEGNPGSITWAGSVQGATNLNLVEVSGDLTLENITLDAASKGRVAAVMGNITGASLTLNNGAIITGGKNIKDMDGLGVYVGYPPNLTSYNATNLTINEGAKITGNSTNTSDSVKGIGIYAGSRSTVTMNGGEISSNIDNSPLVSSKTGYQAYGGGIYFSGNIFKMTGGIIKNNTVVNGNGAGIYISGTPESCNVTISGGEISGNVSQSNGGGLYVNNGTVNIKGAAIIKGNEIKGNATSGGKTNTDYQPDYNGAGVYVKDGTVTLDESARITGNKITYKTSTDNDTNIMANGAGIYVGGNYSINTTTKVNEDVHGSFIMNGGTVSGNTITIEGEAAEESGHGAGVYQKGGKGYGNFMMNGGTVTENTAAASGSGIYVSNADFSSMTVNMVSSNDYLYGTGTFSVSGSPVVSDNAGDDVYLPAINTKAISDTNLPSPSVITISDALGDGAEIAVGKVPVRIDTENYQLLDTVIAQPTDSYSISENDVAKLTYGNKNEFQISKLLLSEGKVVASDVTVEGIGNKAYTGNAVELPIKVTAADGTVLEKGKDYTVEYKDNKNVGTATVTITCIGEYGGSKEFTFAITSLSVESDVTVTGIADKAYTGSPIQQDITVTDKNTGDALVKDTDYTVDYEDNTNAGTATLTIKGIGNYAGTLVKTFQVTPQDITSAAVTGVSDKLYTGSSIEQNITVALGGKNLISGTDYTVTYKDNKNAGTASVVITGKGNYSGTKEITFKIAGQPAISTEGLSNITLDLSNISWKDILTGDVLEQYNNSGLIPQLLLKVNPITDVDAQTEELVKQALENNSLTGAIGQYLDISLFLSAGGTDSPITETKEMKIVISIPDELKNTDPQKTRTFYVVRIHKNSTTGEFETAILKNESDSSDKVIVTSGEFSTYALVYEDSVISNDSGNDGNNNGVNNQPDTAAALKATNPGNAATTGDMAPVNLLIVITLISGIVAVVLFKKRKTA